MGIKKILNQLDDFFDLSKKKQKKKHEKLEKIINSLEEKKAAIKQEMKSNVKKGRTSKKIYHLCKEFKVLSRLIYKAKKQKAIINLDVD